MKTVKATNWKFIVLAAMGLAAFSSCKKDNTSSPEPVETVTLTVSGLKALSTAASVTIGEENKTFKVKGVVISDNSATGGNIDDNTAVLVQEDNAAGILVNFAGAHSFAVGTEVEIGISNQKLEQVGGEIVLTGIPPDSASSTATGKAVAARETTIASIKTNKTAWSGTLVSIPATALTSADGTYKGTLTITDASGAVSSNVLASAAFEGTELLGSVSSVTGIVRLSGDDVRIDVRTISDVAGSTNAGKTVDFVALNSFPGQYTALLSASIMDDDSFTNADKKYGYIIQGGAVGNPLNGNTVFMQYDAAINDIKPGFKTVKVTFAGSLVMGTISKERLGLTTNWQYSSINFVNPFNPATDEYKITIYLIGGSVGNGAPVYGFNPISESFKEAGKFFEVTFEIPTTKEGLMAAGAEEEDIVDMFLAEPGIAIQNLSRTNRSSGANTYAPILIEKVEIGY